MEVCQPLTEAASHHSCYAIEQLEQNLACLCQNHDPIQHFESYEGELHAIFVQAEREVLAEDLSGLDINAPAIEVKGTCYRRALALIYQHKKHPRRSKLKTELEYFRNNRSRMRYAEHLSCNRPIGSGVIEASCKRLVTQRMKCSGMRWRNPGGQGVLTLRSLIQSDWFDNGWKLLAVTYCGKATEVTRSNVIPLPAQRDNMG